MTDSSLDSTFDMAMAQNSAAMAQTGKLHVRARASEAQIDKQSKDFEGMFMTQMLQPMFEGLDVDKTFGGGHGEEAMRSFLLQEYGKAIAAHTHLGIADAVKKEMIAAQGGLDNPASAPVPNPSQGAAYAAH